MVWTSMNDMPRNLPPPNPFSSACAALRSAGYNVTPADIPGLTWVDRPGEHYEFTIRQLISFAAHGRG